MRCWWNEKDFTGIIPEKIFRQDVSLEDAVILSFVRKTE